MDINHCSFMMGVYNMEKIRSFNPIGRYPFDFNLCSHDKGFFQIDTEQDAFYYGTWINPHTRVIVSYTEGDIVETTCKDDKELTEEVNRIKQWNIKNGWSFSGIDGYCDEKGINYMKDIGLGVYLN